MRSSVDLPAPFAPSKASASPGRTSKEIPARAATLGFSKGCRNARQPLRAGGKNFSRFATRIAASVTMKLIACLWVEDNQLVGVENQPGTGKLPSRHGEGRNSPVEYRQANS